MHILCSQIISNFVLYHLSDILANDPELISDPEKSIGRAFYFVNKKLAGSSIDTSMSGTTANVVIIIEDRLFCANVGDSRAIITKKVGNQLDALALSVDNKPELTEEFERISLMGGRVEATKDDCGKPIGPQRVWLGNEDFPGLAMSRSTGDLIASQIGVISEPGTSF